MITTDIVLIIIFSVSILLNTFLLVLIIGNYMEKVTIIRAGIFGIIGYFFAYILISAVLFFFDFFSVNLCLEITGVLVIVFLILEIINEIIKGKFKSLKIIEFNKKEFVFFLAILLVTILISGRKFGFYGMGQDQGVYQTKAIELMYGNNSNVLNFDYAIKTFSDPDDYNFFRDKVKELQGYYLVGQTEPFYADDNCGGKSGLEGIYHGVPTWPAIMAFWGKMLGLSHLQDCQTLFMICFLMIAYYILEEFRIKTICEIASLSILSTTPLVVWVSKSALTEMFLAVIVATYIYLICHKNRDVRLLAWIPITVFSFFHVSAYTLMPLFMICFWVNLASDTRKRTLLSGFLMLLGYYLGFIFSLKLSTLYTMFNYLIPLAQKSTYFSLENFTETKLNTFVLIPIFACLIITFIIYILFKRKMIKLFVGKASAKKGVIIKTLSIALAALVIVLYLVTNGDFIINPNRNLAAMSYASGIISLILILLGLFFIRSENIKGVQIAFLYAVFFYIMIWAVLLRPTVSSFYYFGRYDVPYLLVFILFMDVLYRDLKRTDWIPAICVASVLVYLEYDIVMIKTPDDTKIEWGVVETELKKDRLPNSAYIIEGERETLIEWMLILKASGVDVYPCEKDLDFQTDRLLEYYNNIYFLYEDPNEMGIKDLTKRDYKLLYTYSFLHSEDIINGNDSWTGYPEEFFEEINHTYVYMVSKE